MPPYFGPLSADEPTLKGLSKSEALSSIRRKIRQAIKHLAPPKPDRRLPRNPLHKVTGPWLYLGTGPWDRKHAGRWYQTVCILSHEFHSSTNFFFASAPPVILRSCNFSLHPLTSSIYKTLTSRTSLTCIAKFNYISMMRKMVPQLKPMDSRTETDDQGL